MSLHITFPCTITFLSQYYFQIFHSFYSQYLLIRSKDFHFRSQLISLFSLPASSTLLLSLFTAHIFSCDNIISFSVKLSFQFYFPFSLFLLKEFFFPIASISIDFPRSKTCYLLFFCRSSNMFPRPSIFQFSFSLPALLFSLHYHSFLFRIPPPALLLSKWLFRRVYFLCRQSFKFILLVMSLIFFIFFQFVKSHAPNIFLY